MKNGHNEPRSSSSCAACKLLKRRCSSNCIFAPYFRADEPKKFAKVHKVFGASNVSKILNEVPEYQREETVNSLSYEAEARLQDPVYGCIGAIAFLQTRMFQLQHDLALAQARLAQYRTSGTVLHSNINTDTTNNNVNIIHMNLCREEHIISSDQFNQSDSCGYDTITSDFGQVPDLLPL
ncbi:unnamed protein product [Amaranthus hypochondriacus]